MDHREAKRIMNRRTFIRGLIRVAPIATGVIVAPKVFDVGSWLWPKRDYYTIEWGEDLGGAYRNSTYTSYESMTSDSYSAEELARIEKNMIERWKDIKLHRPDMFIVSPDVAKQVEKLLGKVQVVECKYLGPDTILKMKEDGQCEFTPGGTINWRK